jgi:archaellum component FlaC
LALIAGLTAFMGAIGALLKSNSDRKKALSEQQNSTVSTVTNLYKDILDTQVRSLVEPLEKRIEHLEKRIAELENDVTKYRTLFSMSTKYINDLCTWVHKVVDPEHLVHKPKIPLEIKEHLQ